MTLIPAPYVWTAPPLGEATSAPPALYTDPAVFKAEIEHIHLKTWFFAGRVEELAKPGDYKAIETVGGPAILLRDRDGTLRAFANVCRHRNSILLEGCGTVGSIACPYHGWTYELDGTLVGAPGMREVPRFEKPPHGLLSIRLAEWDGAIFLNYDHAAPDLATHLGNLPAVLGSHRFGEMVKTWEISIETACNWKLLCENAMESFHTALVHAKTVGAQQSVSFPTMGEWLCMQVLASEFDRGDEWNAVLPADRGTVRAVTQGHLLHADPSHDSVRLRAGLHLVAGGAASRGGPIGVVCRRLLSARLCGAAGVRRSGSALLRALGSGGARGRRHPGTSAARAGLTAGAAWPVVLARRHGAGDEPMGDAAASSRTAVKRRQRCRQGRPAAFQPALRPRCPSLFTPPSKPSATLKACGKPPPRAVCAAA